MSDKNIDKDLDILKNIISDDIVQFYCTENAQKLCDNYCEKNNEECFYLQAIENVLINLKTKEIENKDLKEKLYIQGNITEKWVKIAEKLADELSKHIWLNDKDAILKIYREKVEEDEN